MLFTVILAALAPMLLFFVLRHLAARGDSTRSEEDDLWLVGMFGFGTVFFYSSVIGQVWYTAHVVATVLTGLFVLASFEARRPILAGLCVGALLLTRPHMASWALFFFYEAWRAHGRKVPLSKIVAFGIPVIAPRRRSASRSTGRASAPSASSATSTSTSAGPIASSATA